MQKMKWFLGIVTLLVVMVGCGTTAMVQKDNNVDIRKFRTYAWVDASTKDTSSHSTKMNDLTDRKIKESIDRNLFEVGWKLTKKNPDVLLTYEVDNEKERRDRQTPMYSEPTYRNVYSPYSRRWIPIYYPSELMGYRNSTEMVQEQTFTLSLIDAETDKTIWQGWTTVDKNTKRMTDKEIDSNVRAIVKKLDR
ncbi:MAG: DUF4136 domain-containing protein [Bacteroidota bacterium]